MRWKSEALQSSNRFIKTTSLSCSLTRKIDIPALLIVERAGMLPPAL
jgi:hypothetical protein